MKLSVSISFSDPPRVKRSTGTFHRSTCREHEERGHTYIIRSTQLGIKMFPQMITFMIARRRHSTRFAETTLVRSVSEEDGASGCGLVAGCSSHRAQGAPGRGRPSIPGESEVPRTEVPSPPQGLLTVSHRGKSHVIIKSIVLLPVFIGNSVAGTKFQSAGQTEVSAQPFIELSLL